VLIVTAAAVWIAVSIAATFPTRWETIFQTVVAALTLTMVFVIQHTKRASADGRPQGQARGECTARRKHARTQIRRPPFGSRVRR
jgi:low affinity Fe/Cu permease